MDEHDDLFRGINPLAGAVGRRRPDPDGWVRHMITGEGWLVDQYDVEGMTFPVLCDCGRVYDMDKVKVLARYLDCTVWKSPCCKRTQDDRPKGWTTQHNYVELNRDGTPKEER